MQWKSAMLALFALLLALIAGCGDDGADEAGGGGAGEQLIIGDTSAQSGFMEAFDAPGAQGLAMAVQRRNAEGGVNGKPVRIVKADSRSDATAGTTAATDVMEQGAQVVIVTSDFDLAAPAATTAQDKGNLVFSSAAASPKFGELGPLVYTMATSILAEGELLATFAYRDEGHRSAFLLLDDTAQYNKDMCKGFGDRFEQLGGEIAGEAVFKNEDTSVATQVTAARNADADVVVLCSFPPGGVTALRQLRNGGVDGPVISNDTFDGTFYLESVPGLSDFTYATYASIFGDDPNPEVNELVEDFTKFNGGPPDNSYFLTGYSLGLALFEAVDRAGGDISGQALANALDSFRDEPLPVGPTSFTESDRVNSTRPMAIIRVEDGKPRYQTTASED
jgi:branched-chain amino acid transport system substrate-binding protein